MAHSLKPGDEIHCPNCRAWHPVHAIHDVGTEYVRAMLYWTCGDEQYYAGQIGTTSRYPTLRPQSES